MAKLQCGAIKAGLLTEPSVATDEIHLESKLQSCLNNTLSLWQGRNEVYGIRDQRPKKGRDQGS